jgi:hypothetical protein
MKKLDHIGIGERYAHLAADPLRRASDAISGAIAKFMGETTT